LLNFRNLEEEEKNKKKKKKEDHLKYHLSKKEK